MKTVFIEIRSKNGNTYPVLACDLGYAKRILSFDRALIFELSPVPVNELCLLPRAKYIILSVKEIIYAYIYFYPHSYDRYNAWLYCRGLYNKETQIKRKA